MNLFKKIKREITFMKQRKGRGFDDSVLWDLFTDLAQYIYPRVKAFRDAKKCGYPTYFSEYHHNECTKEEYDEMVAKGYRCSEVAAGLLTPDEAWNKVLDMIVYAFEYIVYVESGKTREEERVFWLHYFGFSPWDENNECNRYDRWTYTDEKTKNHIWAFKDPHIENAHHNVYYGNTDLINYAHKCAQIGLELFAEFFFSLWW
jgi:hypothetical protein